MTTISETTKKVAGLLRLGQYRIEYRYAHDIDKDIFVIWICAVPYDRDAALPRYALTIEGWTEYSPGVPVPAFDSSDRGEGRVWSLTSMLEKAESGERSARVADDRKIYIEKLEKIAASVAKALESAMHPAGTCQDRVSDKSVPNEN